MAEISEYLPPVSFFFSLQIDDLGSIDSGFQEVSGLNAKMETETIKEGGENQFAHKVPGRVTFEDLVLKRGLVVNGSPLADWFQETIGRGLSKKIEPKNVTLQLLDAATHDPLMAWNFVNAFPVSWSVSDFNAKESAISIETLTLTYNYFWIESEISSYPPK